jgi:S-adenosylmethionine-diacylgycerolhomoserine-N-methlytransferase
MIPDWFAGIENARTMLKPGGLIGVVDFYVSRRQPGEGTACHSWATRSFCPLWFGIDNVFLSPDHLPFLRRQFDPKSLVESRASIPYLPWVRAPYYVFIGRKCPDKP